MRKLLREILLFIRVTIDPRYWIRNSKYSREWDIQLRKEIEDNPVFEATNTGIKYDVILNDRCIWVSNHPYASWTIRNGPDVMPSRRTTYLANKALINAFIKGDIK